MSEEVKKVGGGTTVRRAGTQRVKKTGERVDKSPKEAMSIAERAKEKERILQVLGRGLVTDAIRVENPDPDRRYVRVRHRDIDVKKFEALGYIIDTEQGEGEHGKGDGTNVVGDTILMSTSRERYDLIQEVKAERLARKMGSPVRDYKKQASEGVAAGTAVEAIDLTEEG